MEVLKKFLKSLGLVPWFPFDVCWLFVMCSSNVRYACVFTCCHKIKTQFPNFGLYRASRLRVFLAEYEKFCKAIAKTITSEAQSGSTTEATKLKIFISKKLAGGKSAFYYREEKKKCALQKQYSFVENFRGVFESRSVFRGYPAEFQFTGKKLSHIIFALASDYFIF